MWQDLKREFSYYKQDMGVFWKGNNDLFDYLVRAPWLTILAFPTHILGFILAGSGYYAYIENK